MEDANMKFPIRDTIPAWYELDVEKDRNDTLIVRIHGAAMEELKSIIKIDSPIVKDYHRTLTLPEFIGPESDKWGFGGVFCKIPCEQKEWIAFRATLPIIKRSPKENPEWTSPNSLRASLDIIFTALFLFNGDTGWHLPQLMVVEGLCIKEGMHGGSLSVILTPAMIQFLARQPNEHDIKEVINAMGRADAYMWREKWENDSYHSVQYRALCRHPKWINLSVPGDACGLDPNEYYDKSLERGYKLSPHNVDSGLQQLSLLMGLAKLHSLAREG